MLNIYITSKGRADVCKTALAIGKHKNTFIVVEPQELELYKNTMPDFNYLVLDANNMGLAYARNYIKKHSEQNNEDNYWVLDDDISNFYYRVGTKLIKEEPLTCLQQAQDVFIQNNIALGGMEYRQYAWSASKPLVLNTFCDCVVWVDNNKTQGVYYNENLRLKIDRDFCIKVIKAEQKTARTTMHAFSSPPNGSNKGGLKEIAYDVANLEKEECIKMVNLWGENICTHIVKKDGRNDLKIHWKNILSKQQSLF